MKSFARKNLKFSNFCVTTYFQVIIVAVVGIPFWKSKWLDLDFRGPDPDI